MTNSTSRFDFHILISRVSEPPRSKLYEGLVVDSGVAGHHARTHYIVDHLELNSRAKIAVG